MSVSNCEMMSHKELPSIDLSSIDLSTIKNLSKINSKMIFSTNFGRDIEYYTGVVFEIYDSSKKEIARGGRYDNLLKSLGSKKNIPAVGAAINLNNLKI